MFAKNILMEEMTYREATEEIEQILDKIENGEIDIDELTGQIKRAAQLLQTCKDKLFRTEQEVEQILRETIDESVQVD
jgi:exodeoxyribonuclease VII small subunit